MAWSFVHLAVRSLFALLPLFGRSERSKELEILVLRHELTLSRRRSGRPRIERRRSSIARDAEPRTSTPGMDGVFGQPRDGAALAPPAGLAAVDISAQQTRETTAA
jgi:hypothetical protein